MTADVSLRNYRLLFSWNNEVVSYWNLPALKLNVYCDNLSKHKFMLMGVEIYELANAYDMWIMC